MPDISHAGPPEAGLALLANRYGFVSDRCRLFADLFRTRSPEKLFHPHERPPDGRGLIADN